jgi:hypothetical protein
MKKEEIIKLIREIVKEELKNRGNDKEVNNNNNYEYGSLVELFKNDKDKLDIIVHLMELGKEPTELDLAKYFAKSNLYEKDEDSIMKHYGYYKDVDKVMEICKLKYEIQSSIKRF